MHIERASPEQVNVNSYASWLRDSADKAYLLARSAYRLSLTEEFLWQSLHAIEKYLKSVALYAFMDVRKESHVAYELLQRIEAETSIRFDLSKEEMQFLRRLDSCAPDRYCLLPKYVTGDDLIYLDAVVWKVRRFAQFLWLVVDGNDLTDDRIQRLRAPEHMKSPNKLRIIGGHIERVLDDSVGLYIRQREILIWQNFYFSRKNRRLIARYWSHSGSVSPPHFDDKRRLNDIGGKIRVPREILRVVEVRATSK